MAQRKRSSKIPESHRDAAINVLANTLRALDPKRMGGGVCDRIASNFVDSVTAHVLECVRGGK